MTTSSAQMRRYEGPAIFSFGFRPFFLGAALLAALTPPLTAIVLFGVARIGPAYSPVSLHGHETIHGDLAAVIAGFQGRQGAADHVGVFLNESGREHAVTPAGA